MRTTTYFGVLFSLILLTSQQCSLSAQIKPPVLFTPPLSERIANYDIAVQLDPNTDRLSGQQVLTWKNTAKRPVQELQFHLYLNGFRNSESTFMIEQGRRFRGLGESADNWGFIDINKIALLPSVKQPDDAGWVLRLAQRPLNGLPGIDLTPTMQFIQPDIPEHIHDQSVISVRLPQALAPGMSVSLYIDFSAKLPEPPIARTGALKEFFFVGQWFPKIGVLGTSGWNCHQFHSNSEFFADFGEYNVWMTVPEDFVLGATGIQIGEKTANGDGTATHFYHAEDVHDFAWTASPEFVEFRGNAQDVEIRALMQRDHLSQGARHIEAAKSAIEIFQNWYGDYPYPNVTIVDPRRGASQTAGMEYPTLFTVGTYYGIPKSIRWPELVIVHEFGHNYWHGMVASNEFEESWLDEGINSYTEIAILEHLYGKQDNLFDYLGIRISDEHLTRLQFLLMPDTDPIVRNSWEYSSGSSYAINSYNKPALYLLSLHHYLGEATMRNILRTYFERWRFKHPRSQDFVDVVNEVSGQNLQAFFDQALYTTRLLDYGISRIRVRPYTSDVGFDYEFSTEIIAPDTSLAELIAENVSTNDSAADSGKTQLYQSSFTVRRLGEFVFPVEIEVAFDDGSVFREYWGGQANWKKYNYIQPQKIVSAMVDPDNKIRMDVNFTNNSMAVDPSPLGVNKLSARWLFWMQFLLDQPEILNLFTILAQ